MTAYETFQGLRDRLGELGYAPGTAKSVDAALVRAAEVYGAPLHRIPVDLDAFDARWRGAVATPALGFRTPKAFEKWRSYVRGALKRAVGLKAVTAEAPVEPDAWRALHAYVEANSGLDRATPFGQNRHLTLNVLIERARRDGRGPHDLDAAWLADQIAALRYERRRAFRRAVKFLNELIAEPQAHPQLDNLLPTAPLALPANAKGALFGGAEPPRSFLHDLRAFEDWYRWKDVDPAVARHAPEAGRRPASLTSYRGAVSWLVRELLADGYFDPDDLVDLASVCRAAAIRHAAVLFSERREGGESAELKRNASTLHTRIQRLSYIARHWVEIPASEAEALRRLARSPGVVTANVGQIAHEREAFLRTLVASPRMQRDVLTLPDTLIAKADALHDEWDTLSKTRRMYCLRIAVAACQTAILLRTMAVRSTNLREVTFRGPCPTLIPARGDRAPRITIPAERVKNGRRLDASVAAGTRPVLQRFQAVYRPLLVADHPYGHHAADSDYLFPGRTMDAPMSATAFAQCFAEGVAAAGLDMSQHMTRHAIAMLLLRAHPESLQLVADWLGDDPETVRAHYAFIDVQAAADDGQAKIADLTRQAKRRAARTKAADTKRSAA